MRYNHYIFDVDGTLLDTERTGVLSLIQTAKELLDRELSYEEAYYFFGIPSSKSSKILKAPDEERFALVWETHFQELMYLVAPFPGVEEVIREIKAAGCGTGIVTSRSRFEFSYDPTLAGWKDLFENIICAEDAPRPKPFPDPVLEYLKRTGAKPEECLYLGDTMHDYNCAHGAGCDFALADWRDRGFQDIPTSLRYTNADELRMII